MLETFLVYQQTLGHQGPVGPHPAGALQRPRRDGRQVPPRPGQPRHLHGDPEAARGQTHALRLMNQTTVLGRYLWVFRTHRRPDAARPVPRLHGGPAHPDGAAQRAALLHPRARARVPVLLAAGRDCDKPYILYIAALFHDIAKGRGGDHSELGAREVRRFCREHGIDREDATLIEFLVGEHLTMSRIAQKEDLSNPDVIAAFAKQVGNERRLTALYLLTVADIRGTSPKVWNAWKGKLLEDLYRLTLRVLGGAPPEPRRRDRGSQARGAPAAQPGTRCPARRGPLWDTLEVSYFMRHDAADIAWHTRSLVAPCRHGRAGRAGARCRPSAKACRCWSTRPTSQTCSRASAATSTGRLQHPGRQGAHHQQRLRAGHLPGGQPACCEQPLPRPDLARRDAAHPRARGDRAAARAEPRPRFAPGQVFPDHAARHLGPTNKPSAGCSASRPATARACSTRSRGCWPGTTSTCSWPRSPRWASGSRTPS